MTRPIGWTEKEIRHAAETADRSFVRVNVEYHRRFLASLGAVHPHEAREREREARHGGWADGRVAAPLALDEMYPSLLPKSPPPLVLSTGTWTRKVRPSYGNRPLWDTPNGNLLHTYPTVVTASDARKLAEWLAEYGSEEEKK